MERATTCGGTVPPAPAPNLAAPAVHSNPGGIHSCPPGLHRMLQGFACSYRYLAPYFQVHFAAINSAQWENGNNCGRWVQGGLGRPTGPALAGVWVLRRGRQLAADRYLPG